MADRTTPPQHPTGGRPTDGPAPTGKDYAAAVSVAGLARELESLRRGIARLAGLPRRVDDVAALVKRLTVQTAAAAPRQQATGKEP